MPIIPADLMAALQKDFAVCAKELDKPKTNKPFWRRTLFRTGFSMIEAFNHYFREIAIKAHTHAREGSIDITAIALLNTKRFRLADDGRLKGLDQRHSFIGFSAFLIRTMADATGVEGNYFQQAGWADLRRSVKVRNRITHPRTAQDTEVKQEEVDAFIRGVTWFVQSLHDIAGKSDFIRFEGEQISLASTKNRKVN